MKTKFMLIISILLLVAAGIIFWIGNNNVIGTVVLMISLLISLVRGVIIIWNEKRIK